MILLTGRSIEWKHNRDGIICIDSTLCQRGSWYKILNPLLVEILWHDDILVSKLGSLKQIEVYTKPLKRWHVFVPLYAFCYLPESLTKELHFKQKSKKRKISTTTFE